MVQFPWKRKEKRPFPLDDRTISYFNAIKDAAADYAKQFDVIYIAKASRYSEEASHALYTHLAIEGNDVADAVYNWKTHRLHMAPDRDSEGTDAGIIVVDNERNDKVRKSFQHSQVIRRLRDLGIEEVFYTALYPNARPEIIPLDSYPDSVQREPRVSE